MKRKGNSGCYLVSYSFDTPGKELVIVGSKDVYNGETIIRNSFTGTEALNTIDKLLGRNGVAKNGWRVINDSSDLPDAGVYVLVRRKSTHTGKYLSPVVDYRYSDGTWSTYIANKGIIYDAWQELPPNTEEDIIK